jgi:hypothetical protein
MIIVQCLQYRHYNLFILLGSHDCVLYSAQFSGEWDLYCFYMLRVRNNLSENLMWDAIIVLGVTSKKFPLATRTSIGVAISGKLTELRIAAAKGKIEAGAHHTTQMD